MFEDQARMSACKSEYTQGGSEVNMQAHWDMSGSKRSSSDRRKLRVVTWAVNSWPRPALRSSIVLAAAGMCKRSIA